MGTHAPGCTGVSMWDVTCHFPSLEKLPIPSPMDQHPTEGLSPCCTPQPEAHLGTSVGRPRNHRPLPGAVHR